MHRLVSNGKNHSDQNVNRGEIEELCSIGRTLDLEFINDLINEKQ